MNIWDCYLRESIFCQRPSLFFFTQFCLFSFHIFTYISLNIDLKIPYILTKKKADFFIGLC